MDDQRAGEQGAGDELPLDFEAWAELSARSFGLDQDQRIDLLEERGLRLEDWVRCERVYPLALAADLEAGRTDRTDLYARKCVAKLERCGITPAAEADEERPTPPPHGEGRSAGAGAMSA